MTKRATNIAASVGQRLRNIARERNEDFALMLTKFALERLLFRLSQSKHRDAFVLKGALLFELWTQSPKRFYETSLFRSSGPLLAPGNNIPVSEFIFVITLVDRGIKC